MTELPIDILPTRTPISPNIPASLPNLLSVFSNLLAGQALIVAIVPFPYVFCDLDFSVRANSVVPVLAPLFPGKFVPAAELEEFEGPLGAAARGDISVTSDRSFQSNRYNGFSCREHKTT